MYVFPSGTDVLKYSFTEEGVKVWWEGRGPRVVKYSQNLTLALDLWPSLTVPGSSIEVCIKVTLN